MNALNCAIICRCELLAGKMEMKVKSLGSIFAVELKDECGRRVNRLCYRLAELKPATLTYKYHTKVQLLFYDPEVNC